MKKQSSCDFEPILLSLKIESRTVGEGGPGGEGGGVGGGGGMQPCKLQ